VEVAINNAAPRSVSIFWIVPQYFLVSVAEILLSVTVYELAYSQAPASMKGLVTGCMFFTIALGNGLLACLQLISGNRAIMNFAYAGAIGVVFCFFVLIAVRYQYRDESEGASTASKAADDDLE
jgi:solute carrier family 15 oligopeptide transporter 1